MFLGRELKFLIELLMTMDGPSGNVLVRSADVCCHAKRKTVVEFDCSLILAYPRV